MLRELKLATACIICKYEEPVVTILSDFFMVLASIASAASDKTGMAAIFVLLGAHIIFFHIMISHTMSLPVLRRCCLL